MSYGAPLQAHLLEALAWIARILLVFIPVSVRACKRTS